MYEGGIWTSPPAKVTFQSLVTNLENQMRKASGVFSPGVCRIQDYQEFVVAQSSLDLGALITHPITATEADH